MSNSSQGDSHCRASNWSRYVSAAPLSSPYPHPPSPTPIPPLSPPSLPESSSPPPPPFSSSCACFQPPTPSLWWLWSLNPICGRVTRWPWLAWPTVVILKLTWYGRMEAGATWRTISPPHWWPMRKGCSAWPACWQWCWSPIAPTAAGWSTHCWARRATPLSPSQVGLRLSFSISSSASFSQLCHLHPGAT